MRPERMIAFTDGVIAILVRELRPSGDPLSEVRDRLYVADARVARALRRRVRRSVGDDRPLRHGRRTLGHPDRRVVRVLGEEA
jgi:hypothetical protein